MFEFFKEYISERLVFNGIDLQDYNYKQSDNYKKIKDIRILGFNGGSITLEAFIEQYLLSPVEVSDTYGSIFDMGSQYEFCDDECEDIQVAKEILSLGHVSTSDRDAEAEDFVRQFYRTGGLISRLKTYLDFDLEAFENKDKQYKCERCKILYFFYMLENQYFPNTNILQLLSKPSMENIDNSFMGTQTYNGRITKLIKESLEKELPHSITQKIRTEVGKITYRWDTILNNACCLMDFFYIKKTDYDFNSTIKKLQSDVDKTETEHKSKYAGSPMETLYLKIVQLEQLGNVMDISITNDIQQNKMDNIPPEYVEEMKQLYHNTIDINDIENYINKNALRISKYVYLKPDPDKEDVRRIRNSSKKFHKWLDFNLRAKPLLDVRKISNELQIISFLQAVILDDSSETFDYTFYGYQKHFKHMPRVQAALKNEGHMPDALQTYWVRKVTDHWYANLGRYDERIKLRELERACDSILKEILNKPTLDEMMKTHKFYLDNKVGDELITTAEQIDAVSVWEDSLSCMGFQYEDDFYYIRYAFLYPPNIQHIYVQLITYAENAILMHLPTKHAAIRTFTANGENEIILNFTLTFDHKNKKCIMQDFTINDVIKKHY